MTYQISSFAMIAASCVMVLLIMMLKQRAEIFLGILTRAVTGCAAILFINHLLEKEGIVLSVGVNPISLLTSGSLGFSGVALLYAIAALKFL